MSARRARRAVALRAALAAGAACALSGCLMLPTNYYDSGSRQNVGPDTPEQLQVGVSTRADVMLALGEPDTASADGRTFTYAWTKVKMIFLFVAPAPASGAAGGAVQNRHVLTLTFDENDRLVSVQLPKKGEIDIPVGH